MDLGAYAFSFSIYSFKSIMMSFMVCNVMRKSEVQNPESLVAIILIRCPDDKGQSICNLQVPVIKVSTSVAGMQFTTDYSPSIN